MKHTRRRRRRYRVFSITSIICMALMMVLVMEYYALTGCGEEITTISEPLPVTTSIVSLEAGITKALNEAQEDFYEAVTKLPTEDEKPQVTMQPLTEACDEAPVLRENTLYYVIDEGYRYDCPYEYQDYIWQKCVEKGMEEYYELFIAQMYHESCFNPSARSKTKDSGLMQINDCNHEWLSEIVGDDDFFDPYTNMDAGLYLMFSFLKEYQDVHKALVCYNMGEGKVINDGIYESRYSRGVVEDMEKLVAIEEE